MCKGWAVLSAAHHCHFRRLSPPDSVLASSKASVCVSSGVI
jgi:hypothetical protein